MTTALKGNLHVNVNSVFIMLIQTKPRENKPIIGKYVVTSVKS